MRIDRRSATRPYRSRLLALVLSVMLVAPVSFSSAVSAQVSAAGAPTVIPIAGGTRYETAVLASQAAYPDGADTVVIATGRNWPDALGGSALAGALDAPILLVTTNGVPEVVADEIARLQATRAVIVGGEVAVGPEVATALQAAGLGVERVAGANRYETADEVALRTIELLGDAYDGTAFVATGGAYADAVAAGPLAAAFGWPLYLAHPTAGVRPTTLAAMEDVTDVLILGGTAAVSAGVETALEADFTVTRLAGGSRYETAVAIATHAVANTALAWDRVGIATGQAYPDALAGGVLQGKVGSVMLLTRTASLPAETAQALADNKGAITTVTYFGGELAVSQAVRDAVSIALGVGPPADDPPADDPPADDPPHDGSPGLPEIHWGATNLLLEYRYSSGFLVGGSVPFPFTVEGGSGEVEFTANIGGDERVDTFEVEEGKSYTLSVHFRLTSVSAARYERALTVSSPSAAASAERTLSLQDCILGSLQPMTLTDHSHWIHLRGVTWSGSQFVAVGSQGTIITSPDGVAWTARDSGTSYQLSDVTWSGTQFVAVGSNGTILTSPNGADWTEQTSGTDTGLRGIAWGGNQFVAVGESGALGTSPDGVAWTARDSGTSYQLSDVTWSGTQFVAVGDNITILTSPEGTTWTKRGPEVSPGYWAHLSGVTWGNDQFVAVSRSGVGMVFCSPDGVEWTRSPGSWWASAVVWSGTQFVAVGSRGTILTSPDGVEWTEHTSRTDEFLMDVTWSGDQYVAVGQFRTLLTSPDGVDWTARDW